MSNYDIYIDDLKTRIDFRKVKHICNNENISLFERLKLFDSVFNRDYAKKYVSLTIQKRLFISFKSDFSFKEIRMFIDESSNPNRF